MRRWLTALASGTLAAALPAMAQAAFVWTLVVAPVTATQGQSTAFSLTATNLDILSRLGCLQVDLPTSFVIASIGTPAASNGAVWVSSLSGNSVVVQSTSGGGRLRAAESVTFTITAQPTAAGAFLWDNHAHNRQDCIGTDQIGAVLPVTVVPAPTPTPKPTPTATPTASPKPTATPTPASTPRATPTPASTPRATPTSTPDPTPAPDQSSSARPSPPAPAPSPGGTGGGGREVRLAPLSGSADGGTDDLGVALDVMGQLDGAFVWFVPSAPTVVPGLLVIAFVALQAIGALAWIPAVRRMGGDDRRRPRSRPSA